MTTINRFLETRSGVISLIKSIIKALKNIHKEFLMFTPDVPFSFSRQNEHYTGFYAFGKEHILRFEASEKQPDRLAAVSVWETGDSLSDAPRYTVTISSEPGLDAAAQIAEAVLQGEPPSEESAIEEAFHSKALREATADLIKQFVKDVGDDGESLSKMYRKFMKWAEENGERIVSDVTFSEYLKKIRAGKLDQAAKAAINVVPGVKDDPPSQPLEYDEFENEILNNSVLYKYSMIAEIVKKIVTWDPLYRNAFIYGAGGVGKTHTIMQVVREYADPDKVVVYKGAISGFTGLLQILWQDRAGKIIILDDNDAILENVNALNLLKGAMENDDPRIVSYTRFKRGGVTTKAEANDIIIDVSRLHERLITVYIKGEKAFEEHITAQEARWYEKVSGISAKKHPFLESDDDEDIYEDDEEDIDERDIGALDPNVDPAYGVDATEGVPDKFQFTSRIIFISNLMSLPQPLMDRCISIGLLLTKEQVLDLIDHKLDNLMKKDAPYVTLDEKKEVLAFMRKYAHRISKPLTFRLFQQLVAIYHSGHPDAKKMMYLTMLGEGLKVKLR